MATSSPNDEQTVKNVKEKKENLPKEAQNGIGCPKDVKPNKMAYRKSYGRRYTSSTSNDGPSNSQRERRSGKQRSKSTNEGNDSGDTGRKDYKRRYNSTNKNRDVKRSTNSFTSEGYAFEGGNFELDEPFSESDDEQSKGPRKLTLTIPRGRIRTLSGTVPAVGYSPKWGGPTMCFSCLQFFDLPEMMHSFAEHLKKEHRIRIVEMELIVDLKRYVEYWRQRFAKTKIEELFPKVIQDGNDPENYEFEMSESVPEDYALRQKLAMRRLEEALCCQQRERDDTDFVQQCIFCRYTARGNRSKIIHHLYMIHHLNLGSPDNLVFVTEYVEHLKAKLQNNECIFCEKQFADRNILMDHMRKRGHKEVNPKNHFYDKFYIINYLELGKRWLDVLAEDYEDTMPTFIDSDEEEEEESWQEWQEDNLDIEQTRVVCLFCEESEDHLEPLLAHIKDVHHFDLMGIIEKAKLDVYDRMKLLNFIRKENYNLRCFVCGKTDSGTLLKLRQHYAENNHLAKGLPDKSTWSAEENLIPIFGNDHFTWMLESYIDEQHVNETTEDTTNTEEWEKALVKECKASTIDGVVAEDFPEFRDSVLTDLELYESLK